MNASERTRLLIVDDQTLITQSFKIVLETQAQDLEVVGLAENGREAVDMVEQSTPDVVLMDVRMPVMDGVQATATILARHPEVRIIMLTTFDDDEYLQEAIRAGAAGYLLKDISTEELISSIRAVRHGAVLVSATMAQRLVHQGHAGMEPGEARRMLATLGRREVEVLKLLAQGYENKEIAARVGAAEQTVKNNISLIYARIGASNRREARRFALECGLIRPQDIAT
jgi:DNA-binding NarL/FixJ family response regulator